METINIFEQLGEICNPLNFGKQIYKLDAIWFDEKIQTGTDKTARITEGHTLRIVEDKIILDVTEKFPATHKVISCHGNIGDTILFLKLENIATGELITLTIKP